MDLMDLNFIVCRRFNREIRYYCCFRLGCLAQMGRQMGHQMGRQNLAGVGLAFIFNESLHLNNLDIICQQLNYRL